MANGEWISDNETAIIRVNKQIHNEASEAFFKDNSFLFSLPEPDTSTQRFQLHDHPGKVRYLRLEVADEENIQD